MDLKTFFLLLQKSDRDAFAARCETSVAFIRNVAYGYRKAGEKLCIAIERESEGAVRCEELRDDVDWAYLRGTERRTGDRRPSEERQPIEPPSGEGECEPIPVTAPPVEATLEYRHPVHDDSRAAERRADDRRKRGEQRKADRRAIDRRDGVV